MNPHPIKSTITTLLLSALGGLLALASEIRPDLARDSLPGVWVDCQTRTAAQDTQPRMEFKLDGKFRSRNPAGEERLGTWRWISPSSVQIRFNDRRDSIKLTLIVLDKTQLRIAAPGSDRFVRIKSWQQKDPIHPKSSKPTN